MSDPSSDAMNGCFVLICGIFGAMLLPILIVFGFPAMLFCLIFGGAGIGIGGAIAKIIDGGPD